MTLAAIAIGQWLKKNWLLVLSLICFLVGALMLFGVGFSVASKHYKAEIAAHAAEDAAAALSATESARQIERANSIRLAEIAAFAAKEKADAQRETDRTLAALRAGTLQLRRQLAARARGVPDSAAVTTGDDSAESPGLREPDAEFLVRLADEADGLALDLNACNAGRLADRGVAP